MATETLTWKEFLQEAKHFLAISERLNDDWILIEKNQNEPNTYLSYKQKINAAKLNGELLALEYHVIYSISYQVPMLYFQANRADGSVLGLEQVWKYIFRDTERYGRQDMLSTLTQMEHPILFRPYLALHPCRTAELLAQFQGAKSRNSILTFISLVGPYVNLNLFNEYGKLAEEE